jgi:GT2 family glycosyltransferase
MLMQCVESLQNQSWSDFEIVVIDDASPEDPGPLLQKYSRVLVIRNECNRGQAYARNRGIEASKGDLLIFLDDDCLVDDPDWIERHVRAHEQGLDLLVGGQIQNITTTCAGRARACLTRQGIQFGGFLQTMNLSLRRSTMEDVGFFDESLQELEDVEFSLRAVQKAKKLHYLKDIFIRHQYRETLRSILSRMFEYGSWTIPVRKARKLSGHWILPPNLWMSFLYWLPLSIVSSLAQTTQNVRQQPVIVFYYPWIFLFCLAHTSGMVVYYWRQVNSGKTHRTN